MAFDSCHVSTPPSSNSSASPPDQRTIFLEAFPDICAESIVLSWTSYIGWTDLTGYDIYFSVDSSSYSYLASVSASDSSFRHENIRNDSEYCYFIKARRSDGASSTSIITCIQPAQGVAPNFHYITQIKVGSSGNTVEVSFLQIVFLPLNMSWKELYPARRTIWKWPVFLLPVIVYLQYRILKLMLLSPHMTTELA